MTFLGHVSDRTKFEELSSAWVHVLPSVKEGWGLSIVEAAHVGVPSVAYADAGGVHESILDGVTGLLAHDLPDLVDQVDRLLLRRLAAQGPRRQGAGAVRAVHLGRRGDDRRIGRADAPADLRRADEQAGTGSGGQVGGQPR